MQRAEENAIRHGAYRSHRDRGDDAGSGWERWCKGCWHRDRGDVVGWGAIFIWGGLVLLAEATDYAANFSGWNGWAVFFTGAGVIVLLGATIRLLLLPEHRRPMAGHLLCGLMLLTIGMGHEVVWLWPLLLMGIGVAILGRAFAHRR